MKRLVLSAACLIAIFIAGCNSGSAPKTTAGQFSGGSAATKTDTPTATVQGESGGTSAVLLPPGAPPEALKTMQGTMGGASGMPKSGGSGIGSGAPGGAPSQPGSGTPK